MLKPIFLTGFPHAFQYKYWPVGPEGPVVSWKRGAKVRPSFLFFFITFFVQQWLFIRGIKSKAARATELAPMVQPTETVFARWSTVESRSLVSLCNDKICLVFRSKIFFFSGATYPLAAIPLFNLPTHPIISQANFVLHIGSQNFQFMFT